MTSSEAVATTDLGPMATIMPERLKIWAFRVGIIFFTAAIIAVLTRGFGIPVKSDVAILAIGALVLVLTVAGTINQTTGISILVHEVTDTSASVVYRDIERAFRERLLATSVTDYMFSALLLLALYSCQELLGGRWLPGISTVVYCAAAYPLLRLASFPKGAAASGLALLVVLLIPAILLNAVTQSGLSLVVVLQTTLRVVVTIGIAAGVLICIYVPGEVLRRGFGALVQILPARRALAKKRLPVRNSVAIIEWLFYADLEILCFTSLAVAPVLYWIVSTQPTHIAFILFNIAAGAVSLLSVLPSLRGQGLDTVRFVRRLGLQYAALAILLANVELVYGYSVGWVGTRAYAFLFGLGNAYPLPDQIYSFRDTFPWALPFQLQLESAVVTVIGLLAVSWVVIVVQSRAWRELAYVLAASSLVVLLPYVPIDFNGWLTTALPVMKSVPSFVLALAIPAAKGLVTSEVQELVVGEEAEHSGHCSKCGEPTDLAIDRFCRLCGAPISDRAVEMPS